MEKARKEQLVGELNQTFSEAALVVVTHQSGLTVAETSELRQQMREAGAAFRVTKNRLAKLAMAGTPYEGLADIFTGPTAIAYSQDVVAAARVAAKFAKTNDKLTIIGGAMGDQRLAVAEVEQLAKLPSLDELRAKLLGMINTPATRIAGVVQAPAGQLARVLNAYADTQQAA